MGCRGRAARNAIVQLTPGLLGERQHPEGESGDERRALRTTLRWQRALEHGLRDGTRELSEAVGLITGPYLTLECDRERGTKKHFRIGVLVRESSHSLARLVRAAFSESDVRQQAGCTLVVGLNE